LPTGALDTSFRLSADGIVEAVLVQSDGKIVIEGVFQILTAVAVID
jgi:hypothetical protein